MKSGAAVFFLLLLTSCIGWSKNDLIRLYQIGIVANNFAGFIVNCLHH
ncbi:MAG: hypothetical protein NT040_02540 [Bacteroidetes bacterium]|nr:hypothetical protein [Bacteroidota bacterium]